eukprot:93267_1
MSFTTLYENIMNENWIPPNYIINKHWNDKQNTACALLVEFKPLIKSLQCFKVITRWIKIYECVRVQLRFITQGNKKLIINTQFIKVLKKQSKASNAKDVINWMKHIAAKIPAFTQEQFEKAVKKCQTGRKNDRQKQNTPEDTQVVGNESKIEILLHNNFAPCDYTHAYGDTLLIEMDNIHLNNIETTDEYLAYLQNQCDSLMQMQDTIDSLVHSNEYIDENDTNDTQTKCPKPYIDNVGTMLFVTIISTLILLQVDFKHIVSWYMYCIETNIHSESDLIIDLAYHQSSIRMWCVDNQLSSIQNVITEVIATCYPVPKFNQYLLSSLCNIIDNKLIHNSVNINNSDTIHETKQNDLYTDDISGTNLYEPLSYENYFEDLRKDINSIYFDPPSTMKQTIEFEIPSYWKNLYPIVNYQEYREKTKQFRLKNVDQRIYEHSSIIKPYKIPVHEVKKNPPDDYICQCTQTKKFGYPGSVPCAVCNFTYCWHCCIIRKGICKSCELMKTFSSVSILNDSKYRQPVSYEGYFFERSCLHVFYNVNNSLYGPIHTIHLNKDEKLLVDAQFNLSGPSADNYIQLEQFGIIDFGITAGENHQIYGVVIEITGVKSSLLVKNITADINPGLIKYMTQWVIDVDTTLPLYREFPKCWHKEHDRYKNCFRRKCVYGAAGYDKQNHFFGETFYDTDLLALTQDQEAITAVKTFHKRLNVILHNAGVDLGPPNCMAQIYYEKEGMSEHIDHAIYLKIFAILFVYQSTVNGKKFGFGMQNKRYCNPFLIMKNFYPNDLLFVFGLLAERWNHGAEKTIGMALMWVLRWIALHQIA